MLLKYYYYCYYIKILLKILLLSFIKILLLSSKDYYNINSTIKCAIINNNITIKNINITTIIIITIIKSTIKALQSLSLLLLKMNWNYIIYFYF